VRAVVAAILDVMDELVVGFKRCWPAYRISKKKISSYGKLLIRYSQKISYKLGFLPDGVRRIEETINFNRVTARGHAMKINKVNSILYKGLPSP
jgi:hypothetical protein